MIINLFTVILVITIATALVIAYQRRKRRSHIPQLRSIALLAKSHNLEICVKDVINGQFIGLDPTKKILILSHLEETGEAIKIIALADIAFCKLENQSQTTIHRGRNKTTDEKEIVSISLTIYTHAGKKEAEIVFFENGTNDIRDMPCLSKKAETWKHKIISTGGNHFFSTANVKAT